MKEKTNIVKASTIIEVVCATHLASYVDSQYKSFGGLMLVGPPEALKSTFVNVLDDYPNAIVLSDLNNKTMFKMRQSISSGNIRTLGITELRKLYERDPRTAANLEGAIRALVDEGFRAASFEDQRAHGFMARCSVIAGLTEEMYREKYDQWAATGFMRRFIWALYRLEDPTVILEAIQKWQMLEFGDISTMDLPANRHIPESLTEAERVKILRMLRHQMEGKAIPFQLMCKIACVLRWHYSRRKIERDPLKTLYEFSHCLQKGGAEVSL